MARPDLDQRRVTRYIAITRAEGADLLACTVLQEYPKSEYTEKFRSGDLLRQYLKQADFFDEWGSPRKARWDLHRFVVTEVLSVPVAKRVLNSVSSDVREPLEGWRDHLLAQIEEPDYMLDDDESDIDFSLVVARVAGPPKLRSTPGPSNRNPREQAVDRSKASMLRWLKPTEKRRGLPALFPGTNFRRKVYKLFLTPKEAHQLKNCRFSQSPVLRRMVEDKIGSELFQQLWGFQYFQVIHQSGHECVRVELDLFESTIPCLYSGDIDQTACRLRWMTEREMQEDVALPRSFGDYLNEVVASVPDHGSAPRVTQPLATLPSSNPEQPEVVRACVEAVQPDPASSRPTVQASWILPGRARKAAPLYEGSTTVRKKTCVFLLRREEALALVSLAKDAMWADGSGRVDMVRAVTGSELYGLLKSYGFIRVMPEMTQWVMIAVPLFESTIPFLVEDVNARPTRRLRSPIRGEVPDQPLSWIQLLSKILGQVSSTSELQKAQEFSIPSAGASRPRRR